MKRSCARTVRTRDLRSGDVVVGVYRWQFVRSRPPMTVQDTNDDGRGGGWGDAMTRRSWDIHLRDTGGAEHILRVGRDARFAVAN